MIFRQFSSCGPLIILVCWLSINDAIPFGLQSAGQSSISSLEKNETTTNSTSPILTKSPKSLNDNSSIGLTPHNSSLETRENLNETRINNSNSVRDSVKREKDKSKREIPENITNHLKGCANEPHGPNRIYPRSIPAHLPFLNVIKGFTMSEEARAKRTSSLHIGENVALCWIETITTKEDPKIDPPKRLVLREFAISFENSASIPDSYLECDGVEGEIAVGDEETVKKSALHQVIDDNTKRSRVVNFTHENNVDGIIIRQTKKVKCTLGAVVTKDVFEWPDGTENPKRRVEIKIGPSIRDLNKVPYNQTMDDNNGNDSEILQGKHIQDNLEDPTSGDSDDNSSSNDQSCEDCSQQKSSSDEITSITDIPEIDKVLPSVSLEETTTTKIILDPSSFAPINTSDPNATHCSDNNTDCTPQGVTVGSTLEVPCDPSKNASCECFGDSCESHEYSDEYDILGSGHKGKETTTANNESNGNTTESSSGITDGGSTGSEELYDESNGNATDSSSGITDSGSTSSQEISDESNGNATDSSLGTTDNGSASSQELSDESAGNTTDSSLGITDDGSVASQELSNESNGNTTDSSLETSNNRSIASQELSDESNGNTTDSSLETTDVGLATSQELSEESNGNATDSSLETSGDRSIASQELSDESNGNSTADGESLSSQDTTSELNLNTTNEIDSDEASIETETTHYVSVNSNKVTTETRNVRVVPGGNIVNESSSVETNGTAESSSSETTESTANLQITGSAAEKLVTACDESGNETCALDHLNRTQSTNSTSTSVDSSDSNESELSCSESDENCESIESNDQIGPGTLDITTVSTNLTTSENPEITTDGLNDIFTHYQESTESVTLSGQVSPSDGNSSTECVEGFEGSANCNQTTLILSSNLTDPTTIILNPDAIRNSTSESCTLLGNCSSTNVTHELNESQNTSENSTESGGSSSSCDDSTCESQSTSEDCEDGSTDCSEADDVPEHCNDSTGSCSPDSNRTESTSTIESINSTVPSTSAETLHSIINTTHLPVRTTKGTHRLALRVKIQLEHIDENKKKEPLAQIERHLLFNEKPGDHGNNSLVQQLEALNKSMNLETLGAILNCTNLKNFSQNVVDLDTLAKDVIHQREIGKVIQGNMSLHEKPIDQPVDDSLSHSDDDESNSMDDSKHEIVPKRRKREIPITVNSTETKNVTESTKEKAILKTLPGVREDFINGMHHVITRIEKELNDSASRKAIETTQAPTVNILKMLSNPLNVHNTSPNRTSRATRAVSQIQEAANGEEVERWSKERFVGAADGGQIRSLTEFRIIRDHGDDSSRDPSGM